MKLACVLVTYNRLSNLKIALQHYDSQTNQDFILIVVDNNSNDGTTSYLEEWKKTPSKYRKELVFLPSNSGGSGGFYAGQKFALGLNPDWIFVSDDDAYPEPQLFEKFSSFILANREEYAAISGTVYKSNGKEIDVNHRSLFEIKHGYKFNIKEIPEVFYRKNTFETGVFTYVGTFLNVNVLKQVGLCNPDFFIFFDDSDHALRMRKKGKLIVVPDMKIIHDTQCAKLADDKVLFSWREYYMYRNSFYIQRQYFKRAVIYSVVKFLFFAIIDNYKNLPALRFLMSACISGVLGKLGKHPKYCPPFLITRA